MVRAGPNIGYPRGVFGSVQVLILATKTNRITLKTIKTLDTSFKNQVFTKYWTSLIFQLFSPPWKTMLQDPSRMPQHAFKMLQDAPKKAPKTLQDASKMVSDAPEGLQRRCRTAPRRFERLQEEISKQFSGTP